MHESNRRKQVHPNLDRPAWDVPTNIETTDCLKSKPDTARSPPKSGIYSKSFLESCRIMTYLQAFSL